MWWVLAIVILVAFFGSGTPQGIAIVILLAIGAFVLYAFIAKDEKPEEKMRQPSSHEVRQEILNGKWEFTNGNLSYIDLSGMDLSNVDFSGSTMRGANFCGATFRKTTLANCDLREAKFDGADIHEGRFIKSDLRDASFSRAKLFSCDFTLANLEGATINTDARGCDFTLAKL